MIFFFYGSMARWLGTSGKLRTVLPHMAEAFIRKADQLELEFELGLGLGLGRVNVFVALQRAGSASIDRSDNLSPNTLIQAQQQTTTLSLSLSLSPTKVSPASQFHTHPNFHGQKQIHAASFFRFTRYDLGVQVPPRP